MNADSDRPGRASRQPEGQGQPGALHLTSLTHEGRFWEVMVDFVDDDYDGTTVRASFRFLTTDADQGETTVRTAVIVIEPTYEEAVRAARSYDEHQLAALLRSAGG